MARKQSQSIQWNTTAARMTFRWIFLTKQVYHAYVAILHTSLISRTNFLTGKPPPTKRDVVRGHREIGGRVPWPGVIQEKPDHLVYGIIPWRGCWGEILHQNSSTTIILGKSGLEHTNDVELFSEFHQEKLTSVQDADLVLISNHFLISSQSPLRRRLGSMTGMIMDSQGRNDRGIILTLVAVSVPSNINPVPGAKKQQVDKSRKAPIMVWV